MESAIASGRSSTAPNVPSLRTRLAVTYAIALAVGLSLFAGITLTVIDRTLKSSIDARMSAVVSAFANTLTVRNRHIVLNRQTKQLLVLSLGAQQNGAILGHGGKVLVQTAPLPFSVRHLGQRLSTGLNFLTLGRSSPFRVVAMPIGDAGLPSAVVLVWRPVDFVADFERDAEIGLGLTAIAILAISTLIGSMIAKRALAPLTTMARLASQIEAHDLSLRLGGTSRDAELGELCSTFDRMLDRLQSAFERERQFTADASHDLRAPLSVIRAEVDLALRERVSRVQRKALFSIRSEVEGLDDLIDAMLHAARLESQQVERHRLDFSDVAASAIERMRPFADTRSVDLQEEIAANQYVIGGREVLERVIASLLHNAIKFTSPGGCVRLVLGDLGGCVALTVMDDGPGFSQTALMHAFDRFWRDDSARGRGGSGLGLPIAKAAVSLLGGEIQLQNRTPSGASVTVTLPMAPRGHAQEVRA